jgi:phosphonate transport system ATP-binding protein
MLEIRNLVYSYNNLKPILSIENLEFKHGEKVAIIGKSGSGKSTLLNCLGLISRADKGQILLGGQDVGSFRGLELRALSGKIGIIFQNHNLVSRLSVKQNIIIGAFGNYSFLRNLIGIYPKELLARVTLMIDEIGLSSDKKDPRVDRQLSGGEMQRVAIARLLIQSPEIILADEPTASLDQSNSEMIMNLLVGNSNDRIFIFTTHNVELAKKHATRIIGLKQGEILFDTKNEILNDIKVNELYK